MCASRIYIALYILICVLLKFNTKHTHTPITSYYPLCTPIGWVVVVEMEVEMVPLLLGCFVDGRQNVNSNSMMGWLAYLPTYLERMILHTKKCRFHRRHSLEYRTGHFAKMIVKMGKHKKMTVPLAVRG